MINRLIDDKDLDLSEILESPMFMARKGLDGTVTLNMTEDYIRGQEFSLEEIAKGQELFREFTLKNVSLRSEEAVIREITIFLASIVAKKILGKDIDAVRRVVATKKIASRFGSRELLQSVIKIKHKQSIFEDYK